MPVSYITSPDTLHVCMQLPTVSLSAYAYLLSELIQYAVEKASSTGELEDRCGTLWSCFAGL